MCGVAAGSSDVWSIGVVTFRCLELLKQFEPVQLFELGGFGPYETLPVVLNTPPLTMAIANACICIKG